MMSRDAKSALSKTIRALRARLLDDLHDAVQSRYRLQITPADEANLPPQLAVDRATLEAYDRAELEAQAAYTWLHRLVVVRLMEASGLIKPALLTRGRDSVAYREFREWSPDLLDDATEGYGLLLQLLFDELALDLPGLFGPGLTDLVPMPTATLRAVIDALDDPALASCWADDTTLGWVYQYWNDPAREELDAKLNSRGKVEPHEVASKTQLFTERYMVEWLLQNSLGTMWLATCRKNGWTAEVLAGEELERRAAARAVATDETPQTANLTGTLLELESRRADWRARREAGEVALDELMPIHGELEDRWKYWVPQPIPDDAVKTAPDSIADLKLLDPACGSGHFLVIAFDYLFALYEEEARHRGLTLEGRAPTLPGERGSDPAFPTSLTAVIDRILSHNLSGIDIDPRCIQIAAAALYLKARAKDPTFRPSTINLVAPNLPLARLPGRAGDAGGAEFGEDAAGSAKHRDAGDAVASSRSEAKRSSPQTGEVGTESVSRSTNQDDPALLDFRRAVTEETGIEATFVDQLLDALKDAYHLGSLLKVDQILAKAIEAYDASTLDPERRGATAVASRDTLLQELENFLARHTGQDDLGLRLYGEQLAAGIRFVRMIGEGTYDVVVANPPYSGTSNLAESDYVKKHYKRGKADLYAAFLERGLQLVRKGGVSAMVTMRGWMFIKQYESLRKHLARTGDIRAIGDLDTGAFEEIGGHVVSTVLTAVWNESAKDVRNVAIRATEDYGAANKRAALLTQVGRHEFSVDALKGIEGQPLIYWWDDDFLLKYVDAVKLADVGGVRPGLQTSDNSRYLRFVWEVPAVEWDRYRTHSEQISKWVPYIKGGEAREWLEPLLYVVNWDRNGLEVKTASQFHHGSVGKRVANEKYYFNRGVAVPLLGSVFRARLHRYHSIFDVMGTSVFGTNPQETVCLLNQSTVRGILQSLNPTVHFTSGDLDKVPMWHVKTASEICDVLEREFSRHERAHESSPEFSVPGCSAWAWTQAWAQECVDRDRLQDSQSIDEPHTMTEAMSWGVGISLGRLGQEGEGWLDEAPADALPHGILYTSASDAPNSLDHPACAFLQDTWAEHGPEITTKHDLSTWLRERWFVDVHKDMYENRPIYFPLSSQNKNFVAHVSIHRWTPDTLRHLLADHLYPELRHLQGLCDDLATARAADDRATARAAEDRHATVTAWLEELTAFIADVEQCAEKGPPPTDSKCKPREVDARYAPDLDDGVMINSAALWPLLAPQWKDPAKWWKQLANETGFRGKHFDWAHLAARYWPTRVDVKCQQDPSLAVAHGTFWRYHPERAYEWELRLQHEIAPDFTIDEEGSDRHRAKFLAEHPQRSAEIHAAEMKRREKEEEKRAGLDSQGELL